jgi:capsular polysaccharide biosynthesis protein
VPYGAVFVFDSSYPSVDVALPIDDQRLHIVVSNRRIEPPPGHSYLQLHEETNFVFVFKNLRTLRARWANAEGEKCIVIAAPGVRPEQLLLNSIYALWLSRDVSFFDGADRGSTRSSWRKLLRAAVVGPARCILGGIRLKLKTVLFDLRVRVLPASTKEGSLSGLYTNARSFSLPPDRVTFHEDSKSLYGASASAWYLPAFSSRRQRYAVQTTRHRLRDVSLHVEKIDGREESSVFMGGRILSYPYLLGRMRSRYGYPVSSFQGTKTVERGICLLAHTSGYYHWLVEGVPRLLDLIDDGIDFNEYPLILPPLVSFQTELLEVLGIACDRHVITVDTGEWCHVGDCFFPTANFPFGDPAVEDPSGQPDRALLLRIRHRLMERMVPTTSADAKDPKRLYISRAKARWRKFTQESETAVTSILASAGFDRVYLEDLTWPTQVRLVAGAESIAGLHGAGLANILFADAKTLLEFHHPFEVRPYFAVMARELNTNYDYIVGSVQGHSTTCDNVSINLSIVEETVRRLIARH